MQITNKVKNVAYSNTRQSAKVTGGSNSKVQTSTVKGFVSTPAAMFKNSTKDDYDTSTLNPLQKRVLSLQEQITDLNSDEKMEKDTKDGLLKPLQEELASVQEQMLKQQEDAPVTDISQKPDSKDEVKATTENNDNSAVQQLLPCRDTLTLGVVFTGKDIVAEMRKEGYTDEQIYYSTHVVKVPELEMADHIWKINDMIKDICDKNGFDYYERPGHMPDMEAILKKNGTKGKSIYETMNQTFSNFEKTIWQQTAKEREGFSFTHDNGYEGAIWKIIIPPSADPNKSRDPLSFIN